MSVDNVVPAPPPVTEKAKGGKGIRYVVFGCLGLIIFGAAGIGALVLWLVSAKNDVDPIVEAYLQSTNAGHYEKIYDALGQKFKDAQSESDFVSFGKAVHRQLGMYTSKSFRSINTQVTTQGKMTQVIYLAHFAKGDVQANFTLMKKNGAWKIEGIYYSGDPMVALLTCPHCGKVNSSYGRYCQFCGQPMNPDEGKTAKAPQTQ